MKISNHNNAQIKSGSRPVSDTYLLTNMYIEIGARLFHQGLIASTHVTQTKQYIAQADYYFYTYAVLYAQVTRECVWLSVLWALILGGWKSNTMEPGAPSVTVAGVDLMPSSSAGSTIATSYSVAPEIHHL